MPTPTTFKLAGPDMIVEAVPLSPKSFAPFGDVVANPRPDLHPSSLKSSSSTQPSLPFNGISANQGSAIKYHNVSRTINVYDQAPSGVPGTQAMSIFVCAARASIPDDSAPAPTPAAPDIGPGLTPNLNPNNTPARKPLSSTFPVSVLERHPYTTQTFIPLTADPTAHYLVIVAPTLPPPPSSPEEKAISSLPVPTALPSQTPSYPRRLPGPGAPDISRLRAFIATGSQAVTYGAGTWHAPMVALGSSGTAVDFVVVQFANGVGVEDCQEVYFESGNEEEGGRILVKLRSLGAKGREAAKL